MVHKVGVQAANKQPEAPEVIDLGALAVLAAEKAKVVPAAGVAVKKKPTEAFFGGVSSALLGAITSKPLWKAKIKDATITAKWKSEFVAQVAEGAAAGVPLFEGLTASAAERIVNAALTSLTRCADEYQDGNDAFDYGPPPSECATRPLPVEFDITKDDLSIGCKCKCTMCENGKWHTKEYDEDDEDAATASEHSSQGGFEEDGISYSRPAPGGTDKQHAKCTCFPNYKERLRLIRHDFLMKRCLVDTRLVSATLRDDVVALFERLEAAPNADWHPGSRGMMQDLIHPSLGCAVSGLHVPATAPGTMFRWLPAEIKLNGKGQVAEVLGRGFHGCPDMEAQQVLTRLLDRLLPSMEEVVRRSAPEGSPHLAPLRERTVQVIAKAASARLTAANPTFPEGSWHLEGVAAEQIIATAIYYPPSPNVGPATLGFRVGVDGDVCYPQDGTDWVKVHVGGLIGSRDYERLIMNQVELGAIPTTPGTVLVFPNNLQHKVSSYSLAPGAEEGRRRVVLFWLIAPGTRIPSTVDVPDPTLGGVVSLAEARAYRELLMIERKFAIATQNGVYERLVSLCEH